MRRKWVVVAHRCGVRIFEPDAETRVLGLVQEIDHPAGRKKSSDIDTDRSGMAFSSMGGGGGHPMNSEENAHEHAARTFARTVAESLRKGRVEHQYDGLVLVAEARFLGMLRDALDGPTAQKVDATVDKDLANLSVHELPRHLTSALGPVPSRRE
jgi:protein required for attachment to host cells